MRDRARYLQRVVSAYLLPGQSQLTFWHDEPTRNQKLTPETLGEYYMDFETKADYPGPHDQNGIPLLDYRGALGLQYNPIAIAQYGLGNHTLYRRTGDERRRTEVLRAADWLCSNLEGNRHGIPVWNHHFDWEYRERLRAPWYSALAQGQGLSLLVRAEPLRPGQGYLEAARGAWPALETPIQAGGTRYIDENGDSWLEEYLVDPPTHILNGFIWATWGAYDYALATGDPAAKELFGACTKTLVANLDRYDAGFWSLYELSGTRLKMVASPFYHSLHVVQLEVMHQLTGERAFLHRAERWRAYARSRAKRATAVANKALFKLLYY